LAENLEGKKEDEVEDLSDFGGLYNRDKIF
jgi:hypothetical protein